MSPANLDQILPLTFSGIRPGDETDVLRLIRHGGQHAEDLEPERLRNFLVARKGGRICGVAGLEIAGGSALLRVLVVDEDHRGQAIRVRLLDAAERYACSRKVNQLYLMGLHADDFFSRQGFAAVDRGAVPEALQATAGSHGRDADIAVCMVKRLTC